MKIVYLLFFMYFFCFSQQKSIDENKCKYALRTDGFYVFDNEIDTVVYVNKEISDMLKQLTFGEMGISSEIHKRKTYISRNRIDSLLINGAESRGIEIISFFSDSLGHIMFTHLEADIEDLVRMIEDKKKGTYKELIDEHLYNQVYDFWQNDSCKLGFSRGSLDYFRTDYNGTLYEDSLVLTVDKIIDTFNPPEDRTYHFYTKEELLEKYGGQSKK